MNSISACRGIIGAARQHPLLSLLNHLVNDRHLISLAPTLNYFYVRQRAVKACSRAAGGEKKEGREGLSDQKMIGCGVRARGGLPGPA